MSIEDNIQLPTLIPHNKSTPVLTILPQYSLSDILYEKSRNRVLRKQTYEQYTFERCRTRIYEEARHQWLRAFRGVLTVRSSLILTIQGPSTGLLH